MRGVTKRNRDWTRLARECEETKCDDSKYRGMTDKIIKALYVAHDKLGPEFYEVKFKQFDRFYEIERRRLRLEWP